MLGPKHTLESVALRIADGLENGSVVLGDAPPAPPKVVTPQAVADIVSPRMAVWQWAIVSAATHGLIASAAFGAWGDGSPVIGSAAFLTGAAVGAVVGGAAAAFLRRRIERTFNREILRNFVRVAAADRELEEAVRRIEEALLRAGADPDTAGKVREFADSNPKEFWARLKETLAGPPKAAGEGR